MSEEKIIDSKAEADKLLAAIRPGKNTFDIFREKFRLGYLINGSTLEQWEQRFKVTIPSDMTSADCRLVDKKLLELHQEASFHRAAANAISQALKKSTDTEFISIFNTIVEDYKAKNLKLPAADTLKKMSSAKLGSAETAVMAASISYEFWGDIIKHLDYCRKLVETCTINLGIEAKLVPHGT